MVEHPAQPIDYFGPETPELLWQVKLLKDEFVHQTHSYVEVLTSPQESTPFCCFAGTHDRWKWSAVESHAVALAIAEALKENQK